LELPASPNCHLMVRVPFGDRQAGFLFG